MSDSDNGDYGTPTPYGHYDNSGATRQWVPDDISQAMKGRTASAFDPSQVAYSANANYEGTPTEYYNNAGNMIGYLGQDNTPVSTSGYNFVDNSGNPIANPQDKRSYYHQTDENGNLLYVNPSYSTDEGGSQYTTRNTGIPAYGQLAANIKMNAPSPGLLQDPLFRNFGLSAAAMAGAAAFAPTLGGAGALGGAEAFPVALGDSITMSPLAGGITEAGAAGLSGLTGADLLKYGQYGLKGLGALSSLLGATGVGQGSGQNGRAQNGGQGGGQTNNVYSANGPWNTPLTPGVVTVGQANQRPITTGLENLEMLDAPTAEAPQPSYFTYGSPVATAYPVSEYRNGGSVLQSFANGGDVHVPEFITGATGHYVKGRGDGQSDDIPAMLADGEYVFDADTVAQLGNGSSDAGAKVLDRMREELRGHKRSAPVDEIPPKAKSPLEYIKQGMKRK